jgi:hypothetical protein
MSAGTGIRHSERNDGDSPVRLFQICGSYTSGDTCRSRALVLRKSENSGTISTRRDGRVVDGGGLEIHCTRKGTKDSNPSPSAGFCLP